MFIVPDVLLNGGPECGQVEVRHYPDESVMMTDEEFAKFNRDNR